MIARPLLLLLLMLLLLLPLVALCNPRLDSLYCFKISYGGNGNDAHI